MTQQFPPILCVGFPTWEGEYQKSTVQLMQALARTQRVLYVEYPFTWKDVYQGYRHENRPWRRIMGRDPRLRHMVADGGELHVLTLPPLLPINGIKPGSTYEVLARRNAEVARKSISAALDHLGYKDPLLITAFNPFLGAYLHGKLGEQAHYYYCYDQIGAARWTHRHGPRLEERLLSQVDGLITSSDPLMEEKGKGMPGLVLKNGANIPLFEQAFESEPPRETAPTLGYLGNINDRIDIDLLEQTLEDWPEARLLMVGKVVEPTFQERLAWHPRIDLPGAFGPGHLPQWVRKMHVGLIPFVKNEFTRFIYPLKINEYLAAGLPVVTTHFSNLEDFSEVATIADGKDFITACKSAWEQDNVQQRESRLAFARQQSWEGRAEQLIKWLAKGGTTQQDQLKANLAL